MDINVLYNASKMLADKVKQERPNAAADPGSSLCLIITDKDEIFSGVTGVRVNGESVVTVCAETNAIMSMIVANQVNAKQMITISFDDYRVCTPCDSCISLLYRASAANSSCQIIVSPDSSTTAEALKSSRASSESAAPSQPDFLSDFDDATSELNAIPAFGAPAEFAASAEPDESNPFYEPPVDPSKQDEVPSFLQSPQSEAPKALYDQPSDAQQMGAAGFQNPYQQQAYPMQGGGYPQQQVYPMQGGGYPQQQVYPMQGGGYPQQQGYGQQDNFNAAPYRQQGGRSIHVTNQGAAPIPQPNVSRYQQSRPLSGANSTNQSAGGNSAFKKRLNSFMSDGGEGDSGTAPGTPSMNELMKQAKDKKKVAKVNADFKKKMKDLGY